MPQCTATSKRSGERCKRAAVKGYSVCYMHGVGGGAPKGSKNAKSHGGYESLIFNTLTDAEKNAWDTVPTDVTASIDHEIKLVSFREYRLMAKIAEITGNDMVKVQETYAVGVDRNAETDLTTTVSESALPMILKIEEALTRIQSQKSRLIDLKYKLCQDEGGNELDKLVAAIDASRQRIESQVEDG